MVTIKIQIATMMTIILLSLISIDICLLQSVSLEKNK